MEETVSPIAFQWPFWDFERKTLFYRMRTSFAVSVKAMDFTVSRLAANDWVHIFPEGKVNLDKEWIRFKWGVGRLIAEPPICPLVLPMWLVNFDSILPNLDPPVNRPRLFKDVTIVVGRPIELSSFRDEVLQQKLGARGTRKLLTDKVEAEMKILKGLAVDLHEDKGGACERFRNYLYGD
ncbi:unnamed protein product [Notodromas monacha]|uniref:Tafazzin family protein n=1 Tax=Notodromas monacha TaxID=399045 RepID=A0A7R9BWI2_9CRUS|nr:unnamed protein product [Notodromas monacha]CAG0921689.1 unnamed protein product [Notodromas monacha]